MATIDERVVSLKMNNKQFLSAIKESASGMDKLKESLKLQGAADGLSRVGEIAKNTTLGDLATKALDIGKNMTVMQGLAVTAFGGIGVAALNAGRSVVSGFIGTIKDGFNEYELKMRAIQTIMANTVEKGTTLGEVKTSLAELNTYADKTVYSFSDMTHAIGLFTAAGVDLQTSVASIKGLSNLAAASGSTAQQTATAYTQLSQAIAAGAVHLQDWNSLVQAGMGGESFRNALIETSRMMGTGYDEAIAKDGNFRESLKEDWLTAQVMTTTLTALTNDLSEAQLVEMGYSEEQAHKLKQFAQGAFDAATKIRTFSQLVDTTKEAIGSGWAETFEILFGDFEEASDLFTAIGDWLGAVIKSSADARNGFLQMWKDLGGRTALVQGLANIFWAVVKVLGQIGTAFRRVFMNASAEGLVRITKAFENFTSKLIITNNFADKLEWTFTGLFSIFHIFATILGEVAQVVFTVASHIISALFPAFTGINSGVFQITKVIGKAIYWFDQWFTKLDLGGKLLKLLLPPIDLVGKAIKWVVDKIHDFIMALEVGRRVTQVGQSIKDLASKFGLVKDALKNSVVGQQFAAAMESVHHGVDKAKSKIKEFGEAVGDKLKKKLSSAKSAVADYFKGFDFGDFSSTEATIQTLSNAFNKLGEKLKIADRAEWLKAKLIELKDAIVDLFDKVKESAVWEKLGNSFKAAGEKAKGLAIAFRDWVNGQGEVKTKAQEAAGAIADVGSATGQAVKEAGQAAKQNFILKWMEDIKRLANQLHLPELFDAIKQKLLEVKDFMTNVVAPKIKEAADYLFGGLTSAADKANENLKSYDMGKVLLTAFGGTTLVVMIGWLKSFKSNFDKIGNLADKISEFFTKLGDVLDAFVQKIKAEALQKIAIALGILVGALFLMSLIPAPKLVLSLTALAAVFKLMTMTLEKLSDLKTVKLLLLTPLLKALGKSLLLISAAVAVLGLMKPGQAIQGVIALGVLMGMLSVFLQTVSKDPALFVGGASVLIAAATACVILSAAVFALGSMKTGAAIQGVLALSVIIGVLAAFLAVAGTNPYIAKGAGVLLGLAAACVLLTGVIYLLGNMNTGSLIKGVLALTAVIAVLTGTVFAAGMADTKSVFAILAMTAAVLAIGNAVERLGKLSWMEVAKGLIALAGALIIMVVAAGAAEAVAIGMVALGLAAAGLSVFVKALEGLSKLNWAQVAVGLVALAGGLAIFIAAAFLTQMVIPGMIVLTASLIALGFALLPVAITMAAFAAVLGIAAATGSAAFLVLIEGIKGLSALLPQLAIDLANAIANFIITLGSKAPELAVAMAALLGAIIYAINANIPGIVASLFILIQAMLTELANHAYEFGEKGATILANFLNGIADNIGKVIDAATNVILNFLDGIARNGPKIIDKGMWTVLKLLEGVRDAINKYAYRFNKVGREIAWAIVDGMTGGLASKAWSFGESMVSFAKKGYNKVKDFFGIHSPSRLMKELGGYVGEGFAIGVENTGERVAEAGENMSNAAYDAMAKAIGGVNELLEDDPSFKPEIKPILDLTEMQKQAKGINNFLPAIGVTAQAANAARPPAPIAVDNSDKNSQNGVTNITFNQTNNSPEALDAATIYRNTNTQLAMAKDKLTL